MNTGSGSNNSSKQAKRPTRRLLAAVGAVATLVGGLGLGFALGPRQNDRAVASATKVEQATTVLLSDGQTINLADLSPDSGAALNDAVYPQAPTADGVAIQSDRFVGAPTIAAGPIVANPGGAPDLTPDPEAGITGAAPEPSSLPDVAAPATPTGRLYDLAATAINLSDSAVAVDSPARPQVPVRTGGSGAAGVPAFVDPCTVSADGCTSGLSGTILADRATPPLQYLGAKEVRWIDFYAPECRRQFPNHDRTRDVMFAMLFNQPVAGEATVSWPEGGHAETLSAAILARFRTVHALKVSDAGFNAWQRAFEAGVSIAPVPHCALVPLESLRPLEAGCQEHPQWVCFIQPRLAIGLRAPGANFSDRMSIYMNLGGTYYPQSDQLRLAGVRIEPLDDQTIEVRAPVYVETQGLDGVSDGRSGIVVAALYPAGIKCEDVNPLGSQLLLIPASRQLIRTRYWTPDPAIPGTREAVITLTFTGYLGVGETLALCVHWITQSASSIDDRQIQAIEQHTVVPPLSGSTEIRVTAAAADIDLNAVKLGWIQPSAALLARCFNGLDVIAGTLRCALQAPMFVPPEPVTLMVAYDPVPAPPDSGVAFTAYSGRVTFVIDNRGCERNDCFNPEIHRVNMRRGVDGQERWVEVQIIRKPYADLPQLVPEGPRFFGDGDTRRWKIDPWGVSTPPPPVTEATYALEPVLDVVSAYATPNPANPTTAIDVHLRIDRPVTVRVTARARYAPAAVCSSVQLVDRTIGDRKVLTVSGLCPGTNYDFDVLLQTDGVGTVSNYPYSARTSRLSATTDRAPVSDGYAWWAEVEVVLWFAGSPVGPRMENVRGRLIVGPSSSAGVDWVGCQLWGADQLQSALPVAGDVWIDFTMSYENGCAHSANTRTVIRAAGWVHWDGVTTKVVRLRDDNGRLIEVTLRSVP